MNQIAPDSLKVTRVETYRSRPWREIITALLDRKLTGKIVLNTTQGSVGSVQWEENEK